MKATRATVLQRVEQVAELRVAGNSLRDIRHYAAEKDLASGRPWRLSDRQLARYVQQADELIARRLDRDQSKRLCLSIARREAIYAKAFAAGDWRVALAVLKDLDELTGLYPGSLNELAAEVERLKRIIEEQQHGPRKSAAGARQAEGNGATRNGHAKPEPGRVSQDVVH